MSLTRKQKQFIIEYIVDFDSTRAAIAAGYGKKNAREIGFENLQSPYIQEAFLNAVELKVNNFDETTPKAMDELQKYLEYCLIGQTVKRVIIHIVGYGQMPKVEILPSTPKSYGTNRAVELIIKHFGLFEEIH